VSFIAMPEPVADPSLTSSSPSVWRTGRALFTAQVISGALGVFAWWIAARTHEPSAVGTALALTGGLMLAGLVGNLGLGSLLVAIVPSARRLERPVLAGSAFGLAIGAGGTLGLVVALVLQFIGGSAVDVVRQPVVVLALVLGAASWSGGVVADHLCVAIGRPRLAVARAMVSGITRLAILGATIAAGALSAQALVIGWAVASVMGLGVTIASLWARGSIAWSQPAFAATAAPMARQAVRTHHVINVLGQTPPMALPIILAGAGKPVQAAAFGAAWQIASVVGLLSPAVATGLFAAGSADRAKAAVLADTTRRQIMLVVSAAAAALAFIGPWLLARVGATYAAEGTTVLRLLAIALVADAWTNIEVARRRVAREFRRAAGLNAIITFTTLAVAVALAPRWGAIGAATAWLAGQMVGASSTLHLRPHRAPRSTAHEDLARLRVEPARTGERSGPIDPPAGSSPASHRHGRPRTARNRRRPASWTGVRYGPWPAAGGSRAGSDRAS